MSWKAASDARAELEAFINAADIEAVREAHPMAGTKMTAELYAGIFADYWSVANCAIPKVKHAARSTSKRASVSCNLQ